MTTVDNAVCEAISGNHANNTDSGHTIHVVAKWFRDAMVKNPDAEAAIEIGVRRGGMSAILCEIGEMMSHGVLEVMSVDPWGDGPMWSPDRVGNSYGDTDYVCSKQLLAQYTNSTLFRMPSHDFLTRVLPAYRWWRFGTARPTKPRFVGFAYLDGVHEDTAVVEEASNLVPFMPTGAIIAIDNTEHCHGAVNMLEASPRLGLKVYERWSSGEVHQRVAFTVP